MKPYKTFFILGVSLLALSIAAATHAGNAHISRRSLGGGGRAQSSAPAQGSSAAPVNTGDLPMPVDEIIRRFSQHESDFRTERNNFTYSQSVTIEDGVPGSPFDGKYQMDSDIVFTPQGKRYEEVTYAPQSSLNHVTLSPEDMKDLEDIQPFVLTTEDLPKYDVQYTGREKVDELGTYVFKVAPKKMEKGQRYFQGTVWVDDHDLAVVKSDGKAVPDLKDNLFPRFITYRENIEANYWFPTYTHADDILHFKGGDVHMGMTVRYKNYKRFRSTVKLGESKTLDPSAPPPAK
jgi:hypothetical protein